MEPNNGETQASPQSEAAAQSRKFQRSPELADDTLPDMGSRDVWDAFLASDHHSMSVCGLS